MKAPTTPHPPPPGDLLSDAVLEALERVGIAVVVTSLEGEHIQATYASELFAKLAERSVDEILAMDLAELVPAHARDWIRDLHRQWVDGTATQERITIPVERPSGKPLVVELGAARVALGSRTGLISFSIDITEREQASLSLRRSEARFRRLVESAPEAIAVMRDGVVAFGNQALQSIPGVEVDAPWPNPPPELATLLQSPEGGITTLSTRIPQSGRDLHFLLTLVRVDFDDGPATIVFARDETDSHTLQSQLVTTDRMAALGSLASGLAHHVNNPLTTVLLNLASLSRDLPRMLPPGPELEAALYKVSEAKRAADRVRQSMRRVRGFSAWRESPSDIDVRNVLDVVIGLIDYATPPGIELVVDYACASRVHAVEAGLAQVFLGLLRNALQAFPDPPPPASEIGIQLSAASGDKVAVVITDSGSGIDPSLADRIFEPFFSEAAGGGHSGLGLSICRSIVNELGGDLRITSMQGPTSLEVTLPVAPEQNTPAPGSRPRVLLVFADVDEAAQTRRDLEPAVEVRQVLSSRLGLDLLGAGFDLVIWDSALPAPALTELLERLEDGGPATVLAAHPGLDMASTNALPTISKPLNLQAVLASLAVAPSAP